MRPSPSPAGSTPLAPLARERPLLVLDLDAVLAPPRDGRGPGAVVPDATRALLRAVALLYPCAVISGRRRAEVAACVCGVPLVAVLGRHGAEPGFGPVDAALVRELDAAEEASTARVRGDAIAQLCRRLGVAAAAYIGDAPAEGEVVRWRFGARGPADDLLRALVVARLDEDGLGARWQGVVRAVGG